MRTGAFVLEESEDAQPSNDYKGHDQAQDQAPVLQRLCKSMSIP